MAEYGLWNPEALMGFYQLRDRLNIGPVLFSSINRTRNIDRTNDMLVAFGAIHRYGFDKKDINGFKTFVETMEHQHLLHRTNTPMHVNGILVSSSISKVYPKMYRYCDSDALFNPAYGIDVTSPPPTLKPYIRTDKVTKERITGGYWLTPEGDIAYGDAVSRLQLVRLDASGKTVRAAEPEWMVVTRTSDFNNDLCVPNGGSKNNFNGTITPMNTKTEPLTDNHTQECGPGSGGAPQFLGSNPAEILELVHRPTGKKYSGVELDNLISTEQAKRKSPPANP